MRKLSVLWVAVVVSATLLLPHQSIFAGELPWFSLGGMFKSTPVDIPHPQSDDRSAEELHIQRVPITECVTGKKLVYDVKKAYEYVTIPETRYRFVTRYVTKEVDCDYCMPTCETDEVDRPYEAEQWSSEGSECGDLHHRSYTTKFEKSECKHCGRRPGQTVVKVRVKECVKEAYVVYRQVKRPVCVKEPRYEHAEVMVTRYVCQDVGGQGCGRGCDQCGVGGSGECDGQGCDDCGH